MIDLSTDAGIREAIRAIAQWPAAEPSDSTVILIRSGRRHGSDRPRAVRQRLVAAAAVSLLLAGVVGLIARRDGGQPVADSPRGWSMMAASPLPASFAQSVVWDGEELLIWGGYDISGTPLRDAAAYRPWTNAWRTIAPVPTNRSAVAEPALATPDISAVVAGEVISIVPSAGSDPSGWDVIAFDPAENRWRTIEQNRYRQLETDELVPTTGAAPVHNPYAAVGWRGELIVVGWRSDVGQMGWARLDPSTGAWSEFTAVAGSEDVYGSPTIVDDRYVVVIGSGRITDYPSGFIIDLVADTSVAISVPAEVGGSVLSISIADDGTVVGVGTDESGQSTRFATRVDAATGSFTPIATPRSGPVEEPASLVAVPGGYVLLGGLDVEDLTMGGLRSESIQLRADSDVSRWTKLPDPPIDLDRVRHTAVWTGHEILVWGGATTEFAGSSNVATVPLADGALYRP